MTNPVNPKPVGSLDDLDQAAQEAAAQLGKASSHNAIWETATKKLKPGLANLPKVRADAEAEVALAEELHKKLADSYDSAASNFVKTKRAAVDAEIAELVRKMGDEQDALNEAKAEVTAKKAALDESNAKFEAAQGKLLGVIKEIQDRQKQLAALEVEVKDAHNKHQLVEAVVKLEDMVTAIANLKNILKPEYLSSLWQGLGEAADDLIQKTDELATAQAVVPTREAKFNEAKAARDEAEKNRFDRIRKLVADDESAPTPARQG